MDTKNIQMQSESEVYKWVFEKLLNLGLSEEMAHAVNSILLIIFLAIILYVVDYVSHWILRTIVLAP